MIKTAIFVEGQTELVFVREYLLKRFDYQNISLDCYTLFTDMEIETWMLGLYWSFESMDTRLTSNFIKEKLGFDLETIDPEITFFHPAKQIEAIYQLIGEKYNKSKGNIEAIMSQLQKVDFELLEMSEKCQSFKKFSESLIINDLTEIDEPNK